MLVKLSKQKGFNIFEAMFLFLAVGVGTYFNQFLVFDNPLYYILSFIICVFLSALMIYSIFWLLGALMSSVFNKNNRY
jgi:hypothetical protein